MRIFQFKAGKCEKKNFVNITSLNSKFHWLLLYLELFSMGTEIVIFNFSKKKRERSWTTFTNSIYKSLITICTWDENLSVQDWEMWKKKTVNTTNLNFEFSLITIVSYIVFNGIVKGNNLQLHSLIRERERSCLIKFYLSILDIKQDCQTQ